MKTIETVGKDIEQALNAGLAELGCKLDDVEVKILVHPGIFRKARVRMTYNGGDATVERKTAASVMRNLEERTKNAELTPRDRRQDGRKPQPQSAGAESRHADNRNADNRNKPQPKREDSRANKPEAAPVRESKNESKPASREFTRDFRAELAAETKPEAEKTERTVQGNKQKAPERKEQPAHSPEEIAAVGEKAAAYLKEVTKRMGVETDCICTARGGEADIKLTSSDDILIGYRGETIEALEYLAMLAANENDSRYVHVNLDAGDYRARRNEMLVQSALAKADKAVATGRRIDMEPMSSASRRIVHAALGERTDVITRSEGKDPMRYIVIIPRNGQNNGNRRNQNNRRNKYKNGNGGKDVHKE